MSNKLKLFNSNDPYDLNRDQYIFEYNRLLSRIINLSNAMTQILHDSNCPWLLKQIKQEAFKALEKDEKIKNEYFIRRN